MGLLSMSDYLRTEIHPREKIYSHVVSKQQDQKGKLNVDVQAEQLVLEVKADNNTNTRLCGETETL